eukprot:CAMPEP_0177285850 /NCGR_PEP_ID=MMETSP0367-20130122/73282_1 /TAXON_ID=447022 ORGANISM="Scrippsiella hangoei-like, Strain SHHI-4" /NCGR_SAMPLE_ID=MMETSP0367 /ASSEMBLY_ACC=CAM_ASM_000362 /LENGTH=121 /DNA_ID=CAMNT_0018743003 /DNA_START=561 /DNA_END=929 /DNA_ORIENTATION=-
MGWSPSATAPDRPTAWAAPAHASKLLAPTQGLPPYGAKPPPPAKQESQELHGQKYSWDDDTMGWSPSATAPDRPTAWAAPAHASKLLAPTQGLPPYGAKPPPPAKQESPDVQPAFPSGLAK